jgi:hypothetical protein
LYDIAVMVGSVLPPPNSFQGMNSLTQNTDRPFLRMSYISFFVSI